MVFFTCNACGESVKKGQVEKHVNICKNCQYLSCIDCGKDFWGDEYKTHVKCISEDQKYGGKGYEAKTNKGDVKQQEWIQRIHEVMKKPSISPKLREILEKVSGFDNIPRKKAKFQNWMKNSLKIYNDSLQEQVWDIFSEATSNGPNTKEQEKQPLNQVENQHAENKVKTTPTEVSEKTAGQPEGKKNKRERKEERQKNRKKEKKELKLENHQENSSHQKSKKRKRGQGEELDATGQEMPEMSNTEKKKSKKKKNKKEHAAESEVNGNGSHVEMMTEEETKAPAEKRKRKHSEEEVDSKKKKMKHTEDTNVETEESETPIKGKFNWKGTIKAVLKQAPDNEISVKKLRKKVLAQYYAVTNEHRKSEEELLVIFNKKISKNPSFRLLKEKVKLLK
ncbi:cell growth-regulating nucleolar protein isoform X1 [Vombatus ursinus]|uniref:Ly1 antibody reactive n=1 Tax=Vombatus ursinus TaxID=29139 RepID=A0A4X2LUR6_VOMUR|nr:cell growth-regulating nucleolar protein isoform X1 [Vombatus ursinus]XP_027692079.1 cell growth-regulating nucleolar protein isoform X1 [Vombatus ursinus]XP_027692080.1 cell growth-regulating nucleolar protein isoform X1 [Vombatus ursinus]